MTNSIDETYLLGLVRGALEEDRTEDDITVSSLCIGDAPIRATIQAGADGVICGLQVVPVVYAEVDPRVNVELASADGDRIVRGQVVARIDGPAGALLAGERVTLNFVGHLSGIASLTARYVAAIGGNKTRILDTRKTTPLLRDLEKYAVRTGGALNHRRDLSAMVLVKENHVRALGGGAPLISRVNEIASGVFVEVEVDSIDLLRSVVAARVDRIMLDNFTPAQVVEAVGIVRVEREKGRSIELEVSGSVTLETISDYAVDGIDFISVGALTHSAPALALSMEVDLP